MYREEAITAETPRAVMLLLRQILMNFQLPLKEKMREQGLTLNEGLTLLAISENPEGPQENFARHMELDKAVVTRTLKQLESLGLIIREQSAVDKRARQASLTPKGEAIVAAFLAEVNAQVAYMTGAANPEDLQTMEKVLRGMLQRLKDREAPGARG